MGISKFHVTAHWMDKLAKSWILITQHVVTSNTSSLRCLFNLFIWLPILQWLAGSRKCHSPLWEHWKPPDLWILALVSQEQPYCMMRLLCRLFACESNLIQVEISWMSSISFLISGMWNDHRRRQEAVTKRRLQITFTIHMAQQALHRSRSRNVGHILYAYAGVTRP